MLTVFLSLLPKQLRLPRKIRLLAFAYLLALPLSVMALTAYGNDDARLRLMVLGDSLVAGHGLPQGEAFPDILQEELAARGKFVEVLNAGVSGLLFEQLTP